MQEGQDWCLSCGSPLVGSGRLGPGWRSTTLALGSIAVLALGAAAAAYAALSERSAAKRPTPVAQTPPSTGTPPATTIPAPGTSETRPGGQSGGAGSGAGGSAGLLGSQTKPPKIPGRAETPKGSNEGEEAGNPFFSGKGVEGEGNGAPGGGKGKSGKGSGKGRKSKSEGGSSAKGKEQQGKGSGKETSSSGEEEGGSEGTGAQGGGKSQKGRPVPILLDNNSAKLYNPANLPASRLGDPSRAIDGESTTAFTVKLEPPEAPNVGVGISLDLKAALQVASVTLITDTPGITVEVYGTASHTLPQALLSEEWVRLSRPHLVKKRKGTVTLSQPGNHFRQLLIWVSRAPVSSAGAYTVSEVKLNEIQLFEAHG